MIDWYIILFLAAGIILYSLDKIAEHRSLLEFFQFKNMLGIKEGTVLVWMTLFTGTSFYIALYVIFQFGLFISIMMLIGFVIVFYFMVLRLRNHLLSDPLLKADLYHIYQSKFTEKGFTFLLPFFFVANMDGLLLQLTMANHLFKTWYSANSIVFVSLILLFGVIISGFGGAEAIYRTGFLMLLICSIILLFVPMLLYMKDGIKTVFDSYHTLLQNRTGGMIKWPFIYAGFFIVSIGMLVTNYFQWMIIRSIQSKYFKPVLKLSLFCHSSVPIAILIYGVYILSRHSAGTFRLFVENVFLPEDGAMKLSIFVIWVTGIIHSVFSSFYSMGALLNLQKNRKKRESEMVKTGYIISAVLAVLVFAVQLRLSNLFHMVFTGYLFFYLTIAFPLWTALSGKRRLSSWLPILLFSLWLSGMIMSAHSLFWAAIFVVAGSAVLSFLLLVSQYKENRQNCLKAGKNILK